ncbi:hypothetical protein EV122DRAFT_279069 [Schizophyllum commune]
MSPPKRRSRPRMALRVANGASPRCPPDPAMPRGAAPALRRPAATVNSSGCPLARPMTTTTTITTTRPPSPLGRIGVRSVLPSGSALVRRGPAGTPSDILALPAVNAFWRDGLEVGCRPAAGNGDDERQRRRTRR